MGFDERRANFHVLGNSCVLQRPPRKKHMEFSETTLRSFSKKFRGRDPNEASKSMKMRIATLREERKQIRKKRMLPRFHISRIKWLVFVIIAQLQFKL